MSLKCHCHFISCGTKQSTQGEVRRCIYLLHTPTNQLKMGHHHLFRLICPRYLATIASRRSTLLSLLPFWSLLLPTGTTLTVEPKASDKYRAKSLLFSLSSSLLSPEEVVVPFLLPLPAGRLVITAGGGIRSTSNSGSGGWFSLSATTLFFLSPISLSL